MSHTTTSATNARVGAAPIAPPLGRLGRWRLVQMVHRGPMSCIFRARPAEIPEDRPAAYAIKQLLDRWHDDTAAIELLRREAVVGRVVAHRHLVPVLAAHVGAPPYFLVMPWLEGTSLARLMASGQRPTVAMALWITRQAAEALDALHAAGWSHGDVKPANIQVSPCGHATLIDLAFARRNDEPHGAVDRCLAGTGHYMAPELFVSRLQCDIRGDIYSLGVTLYEMLSGVRPLEGHSLAEMAERHRQEQPADLRRLVPQLPREVADLVHAMLAKEPLRRPQTPRELIERLSWLEIELFDQR